MSIPSVAELYDRIQDLVDQDVTTIRNAIINALTKTDIIIGLLSEQCLNINTSSMNLVTRTPDIHFAQPVFTVIKNELNDKGMDIRCNTNNICIAIKKDPN